MKNQVWTVVEPQQNEGLFDIDELLNCPAEEIFRDDHRSLVKKIWVNNRQLIAKQPRNKNNNAWIQLTTLWRTSEVQRQFNGMETLAQLGIRAARAVLAIEKRHAGRVVDSWFFYEFKEGKSAGIAETEQVVAIMQTLHQNDLLHDDPHLDNFLVSDTGEVFLIDCAPRVNRRGKLGITHNWMMLIRRHPEPAAIWAHLDQTSLSRWSLAVSSFLTGARQIRHTLKTKIRAMLGVSRKKSDKK